MNLLQRLLNPKKAKAARRAALVARLEEIERTSVWHREPDYEALVEELAHIDGSPFNGHYHWGCVQARIARESRDG